MRSQAPYHRRIAKMLENNPHFILINDAFPQMGAKLKCFWGSAEFVSYMEFCGNYARYAPEKGFPVAVHNALVGLSEQHEKEYPQLYSKLDDNPDFNVIKDLFPQFGVNLKRHWGKKTFLIYVEDLLRDARAGGQKGFPSEAETALASLSEQHRKAHPMLLPLLDYNADFKVIDQAFPHIGSKIKLYWGQRQFANYMNELLHGTRGGKRRGFPSDVLTALGNLFEQHNKVYPPLLPKADVWEMAKD